MWTPYRIVLLVLGFFGFFSAYLFYAAFLGGINGLPPLPESDYPPVPGPRAEGPAPPRVLRLEEKLIKAFGPDCRELKWALKLELNAKGLVVAARDFHIEDDGRLKLDMLSLAMFGKDPNDGQEVEINTVRARTAYLTFDKPLGQNDKEFGGRRIVAAELHGDDADIIEVVNNHRTPARDDDLHIHMIKGPLYYDEAKSLIWTDDEVTAEDDQNRPPTKVCGRGMEIRLAAAEPAPPRPDGKAPRGRPKGPAFGGVESLVLKSDVAMDLYTAGGFLSGQAADAKPVPKAAAAPKPAPPKDDEKSHIKIYTPGRFEYQFRKDGDLAVFEAPPSDGAPPARGASDVQVMRESMTADGKADQLLCRRLELRLSRKEPAGRRDDASTGRSLTIDSAHAIAGEGGEVTLTSDEQKLDAACNDLTYDARTRTTILQGDPKKLDSGMSANQEGNRIHARDMRIQEQQGPDGKAWRQVTARGPGRLDVIQRGDEGGPGGAPKPAGPDGKAADKKPAEHPVHATWQDQLTSAKDGPEDLLTLTGAATFTDDDQGQTLRAETLKVWLAAPQPGPKTVPGPPEQQSGRRPSLVEAVGNVSVESKQLNIPQAGRLVVRFRDVPAGEALPAAPAGPKGAPPPAAKDPAAVAAKPAGPAAPPSPGPAAPPAPAPDAAEPERPFTLQGRSVYAWVVRGDGRSVLERVQADGDVEVHQDPAKGDQHGVDVAGDFLELTCHPEGDYLVVIDRENLAKLLMNQISIFGLRIDIDQAANTVVVKDGPGAMQMESKTDFQGKPLAKAVPMTIHWGKEMFFNGRFAEFTEHVQGEQEDAHLACESLQVFFDHPISLKEGNRGGPPPRVKNLVCHEDVRVDDEEKEGGKLVRYQQIRSPSLEMNPIDPDGPAPANPAGPRPASDGNEIRAPGPGEIRLLQRGGQDPLAPPPPGADKVTAAKPAADGKAPADAKPPAKPADVMKMTYIRYGDESNPGSMYVNSKTKMATFLGKVRVLNMPCEDPHLEFDLDTILNRMPEGALYLQAQRLKVVDNGDQKKSQQEMTAEGHVRVQGKDFWGSSAKMFYNEAKDQIIFEGGDGGLARLYRVRQKGDQPQTIEGKKITYIRSTGMFQIDGGAWISGN